MTLNNVILIVKPHGAEATLILPQGQDPPTKNQPVTLTSESKTYKGVWWEGDVINLKPRLPTTTTKAQLKWTLQAPN